MKLFLNVVHKKRSKTRTINQTKKTNNGSVDCEAMKRNKKNVT
jgi:hypothetical protein